MDLVKLFRPKHLKIITPLVFLFMFGSPGSDPAYSMYPAQPKREKAVSRQALMQSSELGECVVFLEPGADPNEFARTYGMTLKRTLRSNPDAHVFSNGTVSRAKAAVLDMKADKRVRRSYPNYRIRHVKYGFTPNDPYFHKDTPLTGWNGQWHLINEIGTGIDVRIKGAWDANFTGQGVILAILDDGLQISHPDLQANYDAQDSWDFGRQDADPSPVLFDDDHGTVVGGTAAARGGNGIGVSGAAPLASLACLRLDFSNSSVADFADATMYHSNQANHSIAIKNHSYGYSDPWIGQGLTQQERDALTVSAAAGTIHVFASGNDRKLPGNTRDANKDVYQNHPDVITVSALGSNGKFASYSDFGACVFVAAPAGIRATDRTGSKGFNAGGSSMIPNPGDTYYFPDANYTDGAEGTSFSSPLAAGVLALVKQAQPRLNARFAKHLLARYSDKVDPTDATTESDGGWKTNAAGRGFNQNYGFGLINASRLVQMAPRFRDVSPLRTEATSVIQVNQAIPDNNANGIFADFTLHSTIPLEEMTVTLKITHPHVGDLEATLASPGGTTSRLVMKDDGDSSSNIAWTFLSNAFWGENPAGLWRVTVKDLRSVNTGTWNTVSAAARMGYLYENSSAELIDYP